MLHELKPSIGILYNNFIFSVAITWVNAAESQFPKAGKTSTIFCEVTANPAPTVDWLRNGDPVSNPS